eukprot:gene3394-25858_t
MASPQAYEVPDVQQDPGGVPAGDSRDESSQHRVPPA